MQVQYLTIDTIALLTINFNIFASVASSKIKYMLLNYVRILIVYVCSKSKYITVLLMRHIRQYIDRVLELYQTSAIVT